VLEQALAENKSTAALLPQRALNRRPLSLSPAQYRQRFQPAGLRIGA
jgi:hypothetical protein